MTTEKAIRLRGETKTIRGIVKRGAMRAPDVMPALLEALRDFNDEYDSWEDFIQTSDSYAAVIEDLEIHVTGHFKESHQRTVATVQFAFTSTGITDRWMSFRYVGDCELHIRDDWNEDGVEFARFNLISV